MATQKINFQSNTRNVDRKYYIVSCGDIMSIYTRVRTASQMEMRLATEDD